MATFPNLPDQLAALAELDALLAEHGISYWLFGGWAVDFHAGRVTREHGDIDIAVWAVDHGRLTALLGSRTWIHRPELGEDGYTGYERGGVRLEVAYLASDERGHVYTPLQDGRAEWPDGAFGDDRVALQGVPARVIGRGALVAEKSATRDDPVTAAKDRADLAALAGPM
jgi:lincosamide nucleotidyltransferase A/C/D/E